MSGAPLNRLHGRVFCLVTKSVGAFSESSMPSMPSMQNAPAVSFRIRPVTLNDRNAILQLEGLSFDPDAWEGEEIYSSRIEQFADGCLLLEESDEVVGFLTTELWSVEHWTEELFEEWPEEVCSHHADGHSLYISSIAVHPLHRNRGHASVLLREGLRSILFKYEQIEQIVLTVAESWHPARRLYARHGFEERLHLRDFFGGNALAHHDGILMIVSRSRFLHLCESNTVLHS